MKILIVQISGNKLIDEVRDSDLKFLPRIGEVVEEIESEDARKHFAGLHRQMDEIHAHQMQERDANCDRHGGPG